MREGQGYPCYQRDMMMMIYIYFVDSSGQTNIHAYMVFQE